ncbi:EAL domain-containing protein [Vibrio parahaemolyticus]|nr:EAL domain-containing protein [Vibrio parahaemolyticus]EGR2872510.1 EAL domain-containing protein [Vibrio parahaemolyticus]
MLMNKLRLQTLGIATSAFLILLFLAHIAIALFQSTRQVALTEILLSHTDRVIQDVVTAIDDARGHLVEHCDSATIDVFQVLAHRHYFLYDIGLIQDEKLLCTANWGDLKPPPTVPIEGEPGAQSLHIYTETSELFPIDLPLVAFRLGSVAAFASLDFYSQYPRLAPHFSYRILSKSEPKTLASYEAKYQWPIELPLFYRSVQLCSDKHPVCIETYNRRTGLLYLTAPELLIVVVVCALFSAFFSSWWFSFKTRRASMEYRFQEALKCRLLHLEYQPIVNARSERIAGVEALLRWRDDRFGNVSPEFVVQMAEELSLYGALSEFIVDTALSDMEEPLSSYPELFLALNLSSYEILHPNYLESLKAKVMSKGLNPRQIKLEITERVELEISQLRAFTRRAKELGFIVALDDFGTGVANLVWLTEIDFNEIKIDRIFTQSLSNDLKREMVRHIIIMINRLDKPLTFEGVEHLSELTHIQELCDNPMVQGWLYYRAMPKYELQRLLD